MPVIFSFMSLAVEVQQIDLYWAPKCQTLGRLPKIENKQKKIINFDNFEYIFLAQKFIKVSEHRNTKEF